MAKEKKSPLEVQVTLFKDLMERSEIHQFQFQNHTLVTVVKDATLLIHVEDELWDKLIADETIKNQIKEIDPNSDFGKNHLWILKYADDLDEGWVDIDGMVLYGNKLVSITIDGFTYEATIGKESIPLKLKKAEFNNFAYKIYTDSNLILAIKKKFPPTDESKSAFTAIRLYHIV